MKGLSVSRQHEPTAFTSGYCNCNAIVSVIPVRCTLFVCVYIYMYVIKVKELDCVVLLMISSVSRESGVRYMHHVALCGEVKEKHR